MSERVRAVALGGGHGLHASLSALRLVTSHLTAVVTVADDGGSSGRIRHEFDVLPPGDLRMALAALAGDEPHHRAWAELLQHRLGGTGVLAGHPVGNLMLTGLLDQADDRDAAATALKARQPMGRLVSAPEVANAIAYLASPRSASTTGTLLAVDGGMHGLRVS